MKKVEGALESFNKFIPSLKKGKFVLSDKVSIDGSTHTFFSHTQ